MDRHPETQAPAVIPPVITAVESGSSERNRIITPYCAEAFDIRLRQLGLFQKHSELVYHLRTGFPIGDFTQLKRTFAPDNHLRGPEQLDFLLQYVREQVWLRRMSGPYSRAAVEEILDSPFMSSPIFLIEKAGSPGDFRPIQDCSFENRTGSSVNDFIDTDNFPTSWGTAAEVAQIVATAPAGAQAASLDIGSAYRNIPVRPVDKPFLVVQVHPGQFYIDHVCPFGPASGPGLQGQIMDAIVDILVRSGFGDIKAWVDDVVLFRYPRGRDIFSRWEYPHGVQDIFNATKPLGVPWKLGKCFDFAPQVVYVGFLWDLNARSVALPEKKRVKTLAKLDAFCGKASKGPVSLQDTMSITGTLSHVTFVYTMGRAYLLNLHTFISSYADDPHPVAKSPEQPLMSDLRWWRGVLLQSNFSRPLAQRNKCDPNVWVDASTDWGIGIIIGHHWAAWKLADGWRGNGRDIFWAEMIALELACLYLDAQGFKNTDIVVHSDNQGVIHAYRNGSSKNFQANLAIRRMGVVCMSSNFSLLPEWVRSEDNLADRLSRGLITFSEALRLPALPSLLPGQLRKFLISV